VSLIPVERSAHIDFGLPVVRDAGAFRAWEQLLNSSPYFFHCARTVSKPHLFDPWNFRFERKQIPRFVVNIRNSRKTAGPWKPRRSLGRIGAASTSRTDAVLGSRTLAAHKSQSLSLQVTEHALAGTLLALIKRISSSGPGHARPSWCAHLPSSDVAPPR
jgi:hypothetical protein